MEGGTLTTVSINITALEKFSNEIIQSILSNKSLEVTEWDADGWLVFEGELVITGHLDIYPALSILRMSAV